MIQFGLTFISKNNSGKIIANRIAFKTEYPLKMSDKISTSTKQSISADWLVRGVLAKIGETFDRLTGRNWKPSSSLATSELVERLKQLLDAEAKDADGKVKFVPHNIKLKMQWDKFSTDAENALKKLEHELLIAAIDHINDRRYHTYAPMKLEIKPDYFTEGVKLLASFDKFAEEEREAAVNVSVPDLKNVVVNPVAEVVAEPEKEIYTAEYTVGGKAKKVQLAFAERQRLSVGRTKENDLQIDDPSVSKIHAALVLNSDRQLMVADTGSTNGTFVNSQRIAYGKAVLIGEADKLKFGTVEVALEHIVEQVEESFETAAETFAENESSTVANVSEAKENHSDGKGLPTDSQKMQKAPMPNNSDGTENLAPNEYKTILNFDEKK